MPNYEFAVMNEKTGEVIKSGFKSIGDAWNWIHENSYDGIVTLVESNNKETL